ncbi:zinc metalloproteinase nas-13-like isoform X2 [Leguminivora glycinivorella]|uniref:zinc metalloproteinase nas-13-like isoform X2 n=1 Tax=Leguminivora glycinivorella TaxID=1035111 RepID=UPI00200C214C|nr:zinc metalloproteinase nas-13-like isoform X2 [Leguminivora glycinivorella]
MLPHSACNYFQLCLLTLVSTEDILSRYPKFYDDRAYSSGEDTYNEDNPFNEAGNSQFLIGKDTGLKKNDKKNLNAEEKGKKKLFNVNPKIEDKKDNAPLQNDKDAKVKGNNEHAHLLNNVNENIFHEDSKYDVKKLAELPGFKLNSSDIIKFKLWPEAKIPFFIDEFSYDKFLHEKIRGYLENAKTLTGLNFEELASPPEDENARWVFFVNRRGQLDCKDYSTKSFTNSGVQKVIIGYDCLRNNGPMAAIVLALVGVPPQHNAPNRDQVVNISMESILPEKRGLFKRLDDDDWLFHDLDYDYYSIGHYPSHKYTANGYPTITSFAKKKVLYMKHDEKDTYSNVDIQKIRLLYNNILRILPRNTTKVELCKKLPQPSNKKLKSISIRGPKKNNLAERQSVMDLKFVILSTIEDYSD